jgi:hypothetical protein
MFKRRGVTHKVTCASESDVQSKQALEQSESATFCIEEADAHLADNDNLCVVCQESIGEDARNTVVTTCKHEFHNTCLDKWRRQCELSAKPLNCPLCRAYPCGPRTHHMRPTSIASREDGGFNATFDLPFHRNDVWNELFGNTHLGVPGVARVEYTLNDESNSHEAAKARLTQGCLANIKKRVTTDSGTHLSRLVTIRRDELCEWEMIAQDASIRLIGKAGHNARTSIQLADLMVRDTSEPVGTVVTLSFVYSTVKGRMCWHMEDATASLKQSLEQCNRTWDSDMRTRGFAPIPADSANV